MLALADDAALAPRSPPRAFVLASQARSHDRRPCRRSDAPGAGTRPAQRRARLPPRSFPIAHALAASNGLRTPDIVRYRPTPPPLLHASAPPPSPRPPARPTPRARTARGLRRRLPDRARLASVTTLCVVTGSRKIDVASNHGGGTGGASERKQ
jgi:hypothetical protein